MKDKAFNWGGILLILWAATNTVIGIHRYGVEWGTYWWFCNLCCLGIGIGLVTRSRGLITGFLSIACFTQIFWLIDNLVRQFTGSGPFGLVDFMYRPGYPLDEFILAHYHYITMPVALIALLYLPQKKNNTLKLIAIFNPLIFGVSYFVFPAYQNVNCIHSACFGALSDWQGPVYSLGFWGVIFAMHLLIGHTMNEYLLSIRLTDRLQKVAWKSFAGVMVLAVGVGMQDTAYKLSLPSFSCENSVYEPSPALVSLGARGRLVSGCQYTRMHQSGEFLLTYFVENETDQDLYCKVAIQLGTKKQGLTSGMTVSAHSKMLLSSPLQSPTEDVVAKIIPRCKPLLQTASK
jgi:uncharacterized membrane protein